MRVLIISILVVLTTTLNAQKAKRYAIKSGYLKLELSGNTVGTKEIWWDNYGTKCCELEKSTTTTKIFGMKSEEKSHTLTIIVADKYWVRDYIAETGSVGVVPGYQETQEYIGSMTEKEQQEFANNILESMGGKKLDNEMLDAYSCDVFTIMGAKSWMYKGIPIKTEAKVMGIVANEMFVDFKPDTPVPAITFVAPKDVEYENLASAANGMWGAMDMYNDGAFESDDEDDYDVVPVKYPMEKFKTVIDDFSHPGYACVGSNSMDGIHAATFMKGLNALVVMATSRENAELEEYDAFEAFTVDGHKCYYGEIEDEDGTALIVEYPKYDMFISIVSMPDLPKNEMLSIEQKLKF